MDALDLRLIVITDRVLAGAHGVLTVVEAALAAGAPAIQLRDKNATAAELLGQAHSLRRLTRSYGALFFINDRVDVALAAEADGVHLGPQDLPIVAARAIVPPSFLIGYSADQPEEAARAEREGADYIGCGAVFGTTTKTEASGERIGPEGLDRVARAVSIPVVGIGGIGPDNVARVASTAASGAAVVGAVMAAKDPGNAVRTLLAALS